MQPVQTFCLTVTVYVKYTFFTKLFYLAHDIAFKQINKHKQKQIQQKQDIVIV